jgi:hypothetical protein
MSNQRKSEFVSGNFGIQSFWGGHGEISSKFWFRPKGRVCPEFWFSKPVKFPTVVTHKLPTILGRTMDHQKAERVSYHDGIWDVQSSVQPLFCLEAEFSSEVDLQNSITFKPLLGWGWISNLWKSARVVQIFWYSTQGENPSRTASDFIILSPLQSVQNTVFSNPSSCKNVIAPKPLSGWGKVNTHCKYGEVLYFFDIRLPVRFQMEQY